MLHRLLHLVLHLLLLRCLLEVVWLRRLGAHQDVLVDEVVQCFCGCHFRVEDGVADEILHLVHSLADLGGTVSNCSSCSLQSYDWQRLQSRHTDGVRGHTSKNVKTCAVIPQLPTGSLGRSAIVI